MAKREKTGGTFGEPLRRSGTLTWTNEEFRAIVWAAGFDSRAAFVRRELLNTKKLEQLVERFRASLPKLPTK